jgi:hypothetical protein
LLLLAMLFFGSARVSQADIVLGDLLGVFSGNDSETSIFEDTGFDVELLAKVESPSLSQDGLTLTPSDFNDDLEPIAGLWTFAGPGVVDILVVKAGNQYAAYLYTDANSNNQRNIGLWNTADLGNKGVSHISVYRFVVIPEPGSLALLGIGGAAMVVRRRSR